MKRILNTTLLVMCLYTQASALVQDTAVYNPLHRLANQLHLKTPKPRQDEYEIRIWQKEGLIRGAAHKVYVVKKTKKNIQLFSYQLYASKWNLRKPVHQESSHLADSTVWNRLVQLNILTLPDWSIVQKRLQSKQRKDTSIVTMESNGSVTVKANKIEPTIFAVGDGETYYFEVYSANGYREYSYNNPISYVSVKPLSELQKVVDILDLLSAAFEHRQQP